MNKTHATYKLNRFFNIIFNPVMNIQLIVSIIFLVIWGILRDRNDISATVAGVLLLVTIMVLDMFFHSPKYLIFEDQKICFDEYVRMKPVTSHFVITRGIFYWLKVSYSVSNARNIKFDQSFIEKIFDIGHISFEGDASFTAKKDMDRIKKEDKFTIYGIRHFSSFKTQIFL